MLIAKFTGGASAVLAAERAASRGGRIANLLMGAYRAINGASDAIREMPQIIAEAGDMIRGGALDIVRNAAGGVNGSSIEDIVQAAPSLAKKLPGLDDSRIQGALRDAMQFGGRLLNRATEQFTKSSPLFSAVIGAVYRHGDVAEQLTGFVLEQSGLLSSRSAEPGLPAMGPIQNRSGHGIDWVGRALTCAQAGSYVAFEVKGGINGRAKGLQGDQRSIQSFMRSRLNSAADPKGLWAERNTEPGTATFAKFVTSEMTGKTWTGYLIQHDNMRTRPDVRWTLWK